MERLTPEQRALWERLRAFRVDRGTVALTFEGRLARENGWSAAFAHRVVEEYRRFVFLCVASGHPCTPSDQVDQAWHLHLTYTRSYWDDLCGEVLRRPLHHDPTRGGAAENGKFDDWYARTLDSYARLFGSAPPADVWPDAARRFGVDPRARRVHTDLNWIVPKPRVGAIPWVGGAAAAALVGCAASGGSVDGTSVMLALGVAAALLAGAGVASLARAATSPGPVRERRSRAERVDAAGGDASVTSLPLDGDPGRPHKHVSGGCGAGAVGSHRGHGGGDDEAGGDGDGGDGGGADGGASDGGGGDGGGGGCGGGGCGGGGCGGG